MKKILYLLLIITVLSACGKKAPKAEAVTDPLENITFLDLKDSILEHEIIEYDKIIKKERGNKTYFLTVGCRNINDSVQRYAIGAIGRGEILEMFPFHFICKVNGKPVLFNMEGKGVSHPNQAFKLKEETYAAILKKYFPSEYKQYIHPGGLIVEEIYEPELAFITICRNRLVGKEMHRGMACDGAHFTINGKEYYE